MSRESMEKWKKRLETNKTAYQDELNKMANREKMYRGEYTLKGFTDREDHMDGKEAKYVYNALAENIEACVSCDIPMPKVTARRKQDERLAVVIENMLRNELDRMPMENVNDLAERVVMLQGGGYYMVEWDNTKRSHGSVGEAALSFLHPQWIIPQNGVYTAVRDMDYVILRIPQTKEAIRARYGVDVTDEAEAEPAIKTMDDGKQAEDMVTQYIAYYRNDRGGIGKYSWCNDTELEDLEDYQARRLCRCAQCGAVQPMAGDVIAEGDEEPYEWQEGDACPTCGARDWTDSEEEYEEIVGPIYRTDGSVVPGTDGTEEPAYPEAAPDYTLYGPGDGMGAYETDTEPGPGDGGYGSAVYIPYYKPDVLPVVLQKNVSVFGRLLGESDADRQESMQDGLNRMNQKILDRFLKAGSKITLPDNCSLRVDTKDDTVLRIGSASDLALIQHFDFVGNLSQEMAQVNTIYEQMRQTIGVTDSFQGRKDSTATSGTAKQFAAAQAAGRMESRRVLKEAAYAELFEMLFKWKLAYADEPRPVVYRDGNGETVYDTFSKWDFLEHDGDTFWWNDQFLFSCDPAAPLAQNRERLWQETTSMFTAGALGDPTSTETLVEYWSMMEQYHYPGAGERRKKLQERLEREQQAAQMQAAQPAAEETPAVYTDADVDEMARRAAMQDAIAQAQSISQGTP